MDYYLKFKNQKEADTSLAAVEPFENVDVIGIIINTTYDEANDVVNTTKLTGYHVNIRHHGFLTDLQQNLINKYSIPEPSTPFRIWG